MITQRELNEIEVMINTSGITDSDVIGTMIAWMDLNGILDAYLKEFPEFVKEVKRLKL